MGGRTDRGDIFQLQPKTFGCWITTAAVSLSISADESLALSRPTANPQA
jgi:hypothetical protein